MRKHEQTTNELEFIVEVAQLNLKKMLKCKKRSFSLIRVITILAEAMKDLVFAGIT